MHEWRESEPTTSTPAQRQALSDAWTTRRFSRSSQGRWVRMSRCWCRHLSVTSNLIRHSCLYQLLHVTLHSTNTCLSVCASYKQPLLSSTVSVAVRLSASVCLSVTSNLIRHSCFYQLLHVTLHSTNTCLSVCASYKRPLLSSTVSVAVWLSASVCLSITSNLIGHSCFYQLLHVTLHSKNTCLSVCASYKWPLFSSTVSVAVCICLSTQAISCTILVSISSCMSLYIQQAHVCLSVGFRAASCKRPLLSSTVSVAVWLSASVCLSVTSNLICHSCLYHLLHVTLHSTSHTSVCLYVKEYSTQYITSVF